MPVFLLHKTEFIFKLIVNFTYFIFPYTLFSMGLVDSTGCKYMLLFIIVHIFYIFTVKHVSSIHLTCCYSENIPEIAIIEGFINTCFYHDSAL